MNKITPSDEPDLAPTAASDEFRPASPSMTKWRLRSSGNSVGNDQLFKVELALARLENGDYGYCILCDDQIGIPDLEADPSIVICRSCRQTELKA